MMALINAFKLPLKLSLRAARILSVLSLGGLGIGFVVGAFFADPRGHVPTIFTIFRQIGLISGIALIMDSRGRLSDLDDGRLDERERCIRNRAYIATYKIMISCLFGFMLLLSFFLSRLQLDEGRVLGILIGFTFMASQLPRIIIAWHQPTPDIDDPD